MSRIHVAAVRGRLGSRAENQRTTFSRTTSSFAWVIGYEPEHGQPHSNGIGETADRKLCEKDREGLASGRLLC
jgi:hypothetical protein